MKSIAIILIAVTLSVAADPKLQPMLVPADSNGTQFDTVWVETIPLEQGYLASRDPITGALTFISAMSNHTAVNPDQSVTWCRVIPREGYGTLYHHEKAAAADPNLSGKAVSPEQKLFEFQLKELTDSTKRIQP